MAQLSFAQSIGGDNSRWVFDLGNRAGVTEMVYSHDTLIDNLVFSKYEFEVTRLSNSVDLDTIREIGEPLFISNQDGLVLYQWRRRITDTLYNFNGEIGSSWSVKDWRLDRDYLFTILDTFRTEINGRSLFSMSYEMGKVNSQPSFVDTVYETIGNKYSFIIPYDYYNTAIGPANQGGVLRCFTNNNLGLVQLDNSELNGIGIYNDFEFDCDRLTSTNNIEEKPQGRLHLYPNPVHDMLYIESDGQEEGMLYNQQGQQVMAYRNTGVMDMSTLESGIYFLKVGEQVRKVVKM